MTSLLRTFIIGNKIYALYYLAIGLVAFLLYFNTLGHGYVFDDRLVITNNEVTQKGLRGLADIWTTASYTEGRSIYRPVPQSLAAIEWAVFGANPFVPHLVSVLLFALLCLVLFHFLRQVLKDHHIFLPFLATLLFAVHPLHSEVVANIKSRDETLALLFGLLFLLSAGSFLKKPTWRIGLAGVVYLGLAVLSKLNALTLLGLVPVLYHFEKGVQLKPGIQTAKSRISAYLQAFSEVTRRSGHKLIQVIRDLVDRAKGVRVSGHFWLTIGLLLYLLLIGTATIYYSRLVAGVGLSLIALVFGFLNWQKGGFGKVLGLLALVSIPVYLFGLNNSAGYLLVFLLLWAAGEKDFNWRLLVLPSLAMVGVGYLAGDQGGVLLAVILATLYVLVRKRLFLAAWLILGLVLVSNFLSFGWALHPGYVSLLFGMATIFGIQKGWNNLLAILIIGFLVTSLLDLSEMKPCPARDINSSLHHWFYPQNTSPLPDSTAEDLVPLETGPDTSQLLRESHFPLRQEEVFSNQLPVKEENNSLVHVQQSSLVWATLFKIQGLYLSKVIFPIPLVHNYGKDMIPTISWADIGARLGLGLFVLLWVLAFWLTIRKDPIGFALLFYFFTLSVYSNFFAFVPDTFADRFLFFPSVGYALCVVLIIDRIGGLFFQGFRKRILIALVCFPLVVWYSSLTWDRNSDWSDDFTLVERTVQDAPSSALLQNQLALSRWSQIPLDGKRLPGQMELMPVFEAYKNALRIHPMYYSACMDFALVYAKIGRMEQAGYWYKRAGFIDPAQASPFYFLGLTQMNEGAYKKAFQSFRTAISRNRDRNSLNPQEALNAVINEIRCLHLSGGGKAAIELADQRIQEHPEHFSLILLRGQVNEDQGHLENAQSDYRIFLEQYPDNQEVRAALQGLGG